MGWVPCLLVCPHRTHTDRSLLGFPPPRHTDRCLLSFPSAPEEEVAFPNSPEPVNSLTFIFCIFVSIYFTLHKTKVYKDIKALHPTAPYPSPPHTPTPASPLGAGEASPVMGPNDHSSPRLQLVLASSVCSPEGFLLGWPCCKPGVNPRPVLFLMI